MKTSKSGRFNINFYFTVYSLVSEGKNTTQICSILKCSKQRLNHYIRHLKANGYIKKIGYGVWKTSKSLDFNSLTLTSKSDVRSHAFIFSLKLPKIPNWNNRINWLKLNIPNYKQFSNRNQQQIVFNGYKVQISDSKIIVYFPKWKSYFVDSARKGYNYSIYDYHQLLIGLENLFNCSFKINKEYKFKVCRQHQAIIHSELYKFCDRNNQKLRVYDKEGYLCLLVDNSEVDQVPLEEEECVHPRKATDHNELIKRMYSEVIDTRLTPLDMFEKLSNEALIPLTEQIKLHLDVLSNINVGVSKQNELLDRLNKMVERLGELNGNKRS